VPYDAVFRSPFAVAKILSARNRPNRNRRVQSAARDQGRSAEISLARGMLRGRQMHPLFECLSSDTIGRIPVPRSSIRPPIPARARFRLQLQPGPSGRRPPVRRCSAPKAEQRYAVGPGPRMFAFAASTSACAIAPRSPGRIVPALATMIARPRKSTKWLPSSVMGRRPGPFIAHTRGVWRAPPWTRPSRHR
jgi:hypothetical protein